MATICCPSGGHTELKINDTPYELRGGVTIKPQRLIKEPYSTQNGSMGFTAKYQLATADFTLDNGCTIDFSLFDQSCAKIDAYITLASGDLWIFPDAIIAGEHEINSETGEITGLSISARKAILQRNK